MQRLPITNNPLLLEEIEFLYLNGFFLGTKSICNRLDNLIAEETDTTLSLFYDYLAEDNYAKLEILLIGKIKELEEIINEINYLFPKLLFHESYKGGSQSNLNGRKILKLFSYDKIRNVQYFLQLFEKIATKTCPYCNQHETQTINFNDEFRLLFDLDHFYPKVIFPFLSGSLYNLIPSCTICNGRFKGISKINSTDYIYPYIDNYDELCEFVLSKILTNPSDKDFIIDINITSGSTKIININNELKIKERYEFCHDLVSKLVQEKARLVPEEISRYVELFRKSDPSFIKEKFIDNAIGGTLDPTRILDYQKGKFIKDIALRLGITY